MTKDEWAKISIVVAAWFALAVFGVIVERSKDRERVASSPSTTVRR